MGADEHIDAVDLMQGEPVDGFQPARRRDFFRARPAKALGCKSDPPGLGEGELFCFRHVAPLAAFRPNSGPISTATAPAIISTQPRSADSRQTLAEQERARERGEHALEGENERRLGGRRMRLREDLDRIGDRARNNAGEQDRRHGRDERARRHGFEQGRTQRREAGADRILHEGEQQRPAGAGKEDRRQRDDRRPGEIGEEHERVADVRRTERPARGEQPRADERYEARANDDRARTRSSQRPDDERGQHHIAGGQEAGVGGAGRLDPRLLQGGAEEEREGDHERQAPFVAVRGMRLAAKLPERERGER